MKNKRFIQIFIVLIVLAAVIALACFTGLPLVEMMQKHISGGM